MTTKEKIKFAKKGLKKLYKCSIKEIDQNKDDDDLIDRIYKSTKTRLELLDLSEKCNIANEMIDNTK